jgi:uncharacterized membrane protein YjjB (DUF3815 family)
MTTKTWIWIGVAAVAAYGVYYYSKKAKTAAATTTVKEEVKK